MERPLWEREETAPAGIGPPGGEGFEAGPERSAMELVHARRRRGWVSRLAQTYSEAYGGLPRAAWLLALLELVNRSGMMVLFFLTIYMTRKLGFTVVQAGTVMSAYGVGSMLGTYLGGRLCDRLGAYHVQKLSLGVSAVVLIVLQWPRSAWLLALLMLALAAFSDALHPANAAATAQICTPELRPKGFALHRLAGNLGISVGPVVGGALALLDYRWLFWADGLTSLAACALAFVFLRSAGPHGEAHAEAAPPALPVWRNRAFLRLLPLVFGIGLVFSQFFSTYPLYLRLHYGMSESGIGRLIAVNTLLIVTVEMLLMHALRQHSPARVIAIGTLLLGLGFGLTPFGSTALVRRVQRGGLDVRRDPDPADAADAHDAALGSRGDGRVPGPDEPGVRDGHDVRAAAGDPALGGRRTRVGVVRVRGARRGDGARLRAHPCRRHGDAGGVERS